MDIQTFRAKTMPQALDLVRRELGPSAVVLHTRELHGGLVGRLIFGRAFEVAATADNQRQASPQSKIQNPKSKIIPPRPERLAPLAESTLELDSNEPLFPPRNPPTPSPRSLPPALFELFTDLIEADVDEETARQLLDRLAREPAGRLADADEARRRLTSFVQQDLRTSGPIGAPTGGGRVVALVGPTGVGKTTTIAKLAANFRLRDNKRVGLVTVDTYRIAAVEQLRTYAEIIDLPMEVVGTPREMRAAIDKMRDFDLILMDTAGRSPRDEVRIRELRAMLAEANPNEVHLVLSAASSARHLIGAAEKFGPAGVTSLIVTKLDEATSHGHLLTLARRCRLPMSYLTDGQNVPDDITVADSRELAELILEARAFA